MKRFLNVLDAAIPYRPCGCTRGTQPVSRWGMPSPSPTWIWRASSARGWEVVRRLTGGRAILHTDELTYSVTGPATEPVLAGSVLESYNRIAQALLLAVQDIGAAC